MSWRDDWGRYPQPAPKLPPPERGIKVKKIGATWWGQRWIEALETLSLGYSNRLARGRTYAHAGRVHDLEVQPGCVTAQVTGSRPQPYQVTLRLAVLTGAAWDRAVAEMAKQAVFAAELLAGQMPRDVDAAFHQAGASLFPEQERDLRTDCSCPDWANPCKHVAATHYALGEAFDKDPFLLFELRGRGKERVLGTLRKLRAGAKGAADAAGSAPATEAIPSVSLVGYGPGEFEQLRGPVAQLRFSIAPPGSPAAVLRQLGAPSSWSLDETPLALLGPLYQAAGILARDLALRPSESSQQLPPVPDAPTANLPARASRQPKPRPNARSRDSAPAGKSGSPAATRRRRPAQR